MVLKWSKLSTLVFIKGKKWSKLSKLVFKKGQIYQNWCFKKVKKGQNCPRGDQNRPRENS